MKVEKATIIPNSTGSKIGREKNTMREVYRLYIAIVSIHYHSYTNLLAWFTLLFNWTTKTNACVWTCLRRCHTVNLQHINMTSTWLYSLTLNYMFTFFQRSRSKVKVTGVKSSIFAFKPITQKVFIRFAQKSKFRLNKFSDRSLFQGDLDRSKVKVIAGVKLSKFSKNYLIPQISLRHSDETSHDYPR